MASGASTREQATHEKRKWVRLTRACNNHCLFCLDADIQGDKIRPTGEIRREIIAGRGEDCRRLILSGGEPTIHPDYLDFVALGREQEYDWIQTVTNGRMFAYREFAHKAAGAGLDETTFSMHGHTAELHDRLVGVAGAFTQSLAGMQNLRERGVLVNVDIVLNALNVPFFPEIVEFFLGKGVGEFDLLWMVPFGSAWKNRSELYPDQGAALPKLREAIQTAQTAGAVVWTNRLPARLLEGHEELIQDPHKLHDEVRGRAPEFDELLRDGTALKCREEPRCSLCPMEGYCRELEQTAAAVASGRIPALAVDLRRKIPPKAIPLIEAASGLRLVCADLRQAVDFLESLAPARRNIVAVPARVSDHMPIDDLNSVHGKLIRLASDDPVVLESIWQNGTVGVELILNRRSTGWIRDRADLLRNDPGRLSISLQTFATLGDTGREGVEPVESLAILAGSRNPRLIRLPPCLLPGAECLDEPAPIAFEALPLGGGQQLSEFTDYFVLHHHRAHSLSCEKCSEKRRCPGWSVNLVRKYGFGALCRPILV